MTADMSHSQPILRPASDAYRKIEGFPLNKTVDSKPALPNNPNEIMALITQLEQAKAELSTLKNQLEPTQEQRLAQLDPEMARQTLLADPVGFIRSIVDAAASIHLADLKERAELNGALNVYRKANPEFERFESFILPIVAELIQNDPDGVIDPWQTLFEKAYQQFKDRFKDILKNNPDLLQADDLEKNSTSALRPGKLMEGSANRILPKEAPGFTREQIARMSLDDFIRNEQAINLALQQGRIA